MDSRLQNSNCASPTPEYSRLCHNLALPSCPRPVVHWAWLVLCYVPLVRRPELPRGWECRGWRGYHKHVTIDRWASEKTRARGAGRLVRVLGLVDRRRLPVPLQRPRAVLLLHVHDAHVVVGGGEAHAAGCLGLRNRSIPPVQLQRGRTPACRCARCPCSGSSRRRARSAGRTPARRSRAPCRAPRARPRGPLARGTRNPCSGGWWR